MIVGRLISFAILILMAIGWYYDDTKPRRPRGSRRIERRYAKAAKREREQRARAQDPKWAAILERRARTRDRKLLRSVSWAIVAEAPELFATEEIRAAILLTMHKFSDREFGSVFDRSLRLLQEQTNQF